MKEPIDGLRFKGYGIDELRYRRAYALAKYEMAKMGLMGQVDMVKESVEGFGPKGLLGRILSNLNWIDYALIGYNIYARIKKLKKR